MAQTEKKTVAANKACLTTRVRMGKDTYGPGDEWLFASRSDVTDAMLQNLQERKIATGDWDTLRAKIAAGEAAPPVASPLADAEKDNTIAELEQDLETAQEAYDTVKAERDEARADVKQLTSAASAAKTEYQTQIAQLTAERSVALAQVETLTQQLLERTAERDEARAERDKLQGDLNLISTGEREDTPADGEADATPAAPTKPARNSK